MITIEIIAVGKIKDDYFKKAIDEYAKRLSRYCMIKITEVQDFPDDQNSIEREGSLIIPKIKGLCIPLCIEGKQLKSEELADFIEKSGIEGNSYITFIIGGSSGLSEKIKSIGKLKLSFSKMTFPHQLMRVILLEQIYRAFKIISGEAYHK